MNELMTETTDRAADMVWRVMCQVSGGFTGTRKAFLKGADGEIEEFETEEGAQARAAGLSERMNGNQYRTADFRYWAVGMFPKEGR